MSSQSYHREILVSNTPAKAYQALTGGFDKWWTPSSTPIGKPGDVVTFSFGETYWKMRVSNLEPDTSVELECVEANHVDERSPASIRREWEGSALKWNIAKEGERTRISFVHEGLVPSLDCYEICELGWDHYFGKVLKEYLDGESA